MRDAAGAVGVASSSEQGSPVKGGSAHIGLRVPSRRLGSKYLGVNGLVEDNVGLGRTPAMWWTQNCAYNAVHDVHRLNIDGKHALEALDIGVESYVKVRQQFARDCPDLIAYQIVLRTELNMRIVGRRASEALAS